MDINNSVQLNVFLADDDPDDRMFFSDAIAVLPLNVILSTAKDGDKLMQLLLNPDTVLPDIIFLDLNMPFKNGFQCLSEIRGHPRLNDIFIAIYSTSASSREVQETFSKGANLFVHKPNTFTELKLMLNKVLNMNFKQHLHPAKEKFVLDAYS